MEGRTGSARDSLPPPPTTASKQGKATSARLELVVLAQVLVAAGAALAAGRRVDLGDDGAAHVLHLLQLLLVVLLLRVLRGQAGRLRRQ